MEQIIENIRRCKDIDSANEFMFSYVDLDSKVVEALNFAISSHEGQKRKSGEDYVIHPIIVAGIVGYLGGDNAMIISALLHDTVEDTPTTIEDVERMFGKEVADLVEGLTKIVEIRQDKLEPSSSNKSIVSSALTFHKMLLASIKDVRILVVKLCDRFHNMLTIDALREIKQKRIAEETLLVYAPIAHRLGISTIKNYLEDLSFAKVMPEQYNEIDNFLSKHKHQIQLRLNHFVEHIKNLMMQNGFSEDSFEIQKRMKHYYSIHLKLQRKGISIEEVLDLVAIRILVQDPLDCYKVLGLLHTKFNPIIARFKDYIAIPKENGYQTIHTTFFDDLAIIEGQIRTYNMHKTAEFGVAAHWKYKDGGGKNPNLDWLNSLDVKSNKEINVGDSIEEFYDYATSNLYSEDIVVFSPTGDTYTLSRGSIVLDFAYEIHSEIGLRAKEAYINNKRVSLLTELKNGDVVHIITGNKDIPRCSWINMVKTPKAKHIMMQICKQQTKKIDLAGSYNILATIFSIRKRKLIYWLEHENISNVVEKCTSDEVYLKNLVENLKKYPKADKVLFPFFKKDKYRLKRQIFDNIIIFSNHTIKNIEFDYCCHPKRGDDIVGLKKGSTVTIHHKLCSSIHDKIDFGCDMVFVRWSHSKSQRYCMVINIDNKRGALGECLMYLANLKLDLVRIKPKQSEDDGALFFYEFVIEMDGKADPKKIEKKIEDKYNLIQFASLDDAYKGF